MRLSNMRVIIVAMGCLFIMITCGCSSKTEQQKEHKKTISIKKKKDESRKRAMENKKSLDDILAPDEKVDEIHEVEDRDVSDIN